MRESVIVRSHVNEPLDLEIRLSCGVDFADVFEVRHKRVKKAGVSTTAHNADHCLLTFRYDNPPFSAVCRIHSSEHAQIEGDDFVYRVRLEPRGSWETSIRLAPHGDDVIAEPVHGEFGDSEREAAAVLRKWRQEVPRLEASWDELQHVYRRSLVDLAALRLQATVEGNEFALPAAGLPWFMAIFGRDTLIASYQSLLIGPELARGALKSLASLQGTESNDFKDEDPGKILHEIRFGELTALGLRPHRPYYGNADATQLWLILLSEYWRFTGDNATVLDLKDNVIRALAWIDNYGDADGDGYVEYKTRSSQGLVNQSWKDSWNSMMFADGRVAEAPIAGCEIQGYVYDAKMRTAELAEKIFGDPELGARLRSEASALFDRFNEDFWVDARGGYYAVALDKHKQRVDAMTSNMGHLLWSGIVPQDRAGILAKQFFTEGMFSGWGVRTMSSDEMGYNPISYHNGTIWPHDNSLIAAGLARYGFRDEAARIGLAMIQAATQTGYRLPEVFAGYTRGHSRFPVRYPTACSPQAWATGAPFLLLRVMLGVEASNGALTVDPELPKECGALLFEGIHAFGTRFDIRAEGNAGDVSQAD
jgi:glycogen debranching enzyme